MTDHDEFTPLSSPQWANPYAVENYVAMLIQSNYPPMPTSIRLSRAMTLAYEHGFHEGARVARAIARQRRRKGKS